MIWDFWPPGCRRNPFWTLGPLLGVICYRSPRKLMPLPLDHPSRQLPPTRGPGLPTRAADALSLQPHGLHSVLHCEHHHLAESKTQPKPPRVAATPVSRRIEPSRACWGQGWATRPSLPAWPPEPTCPTGCAAVGDGIPRALPLRPGSHRGRERSALSCRGGFCGASPHLWVLCGQPGLQVCGWGCSNTLPRGGSSRTDGPTRVHPGF